jgi:hypothetical protein
VANENLTHFENRSMIFPALNLHVDPGLEGIVFAPGSRSFQIPHFKGTVGQHGTAGPFGGPWFRERFLGHPNGMRRQTVSACQGYLPTLGQNNIYYYYYHYYLLLTPALKVRHQSSRQTLF